jgi:hypothetical protein
MPSEERTIAIRRPVDQVFRFLSDARTASQWRTAGYEVTALELDRRIVLRTRAGRFTSEGELTLEAMGDATILTFALRGALSGWRRLVRGGALQSALTAAMQELDDLQELLER